MNSVHFPRTVRGALWAFLLGTLLGWTPLSIAQAVLKVSAIPDEAPTELQRKFAPLGKYLEAKTGAKVEFTPVTDYAATVEGLAGKKLDMVWYGGFTFVQADKRTNGGAIPLVQRAEDEQFKSVFITKAGSGIKSLADLKGKNFAFGSVSSTSGHLMPRSFMLQAGLNPDKDMRVAYSGAHDATAFQVSGGKVDAGALNISVWQKLVEDKKIDPKEVVVFYTTPALLRLQLDGARRPRPRAHREDQGRVPRARSRTSRKTPRS